MSIRQNSGARTIPGRQQMERPASGSDSIPKFVMAVDQAIYMQTINSGSVSRQRVQRYLYVENTMASCCSLSL